MIGATAKADQFRDRSGNESTKPSRSGRNLLGWGDAEALTIPQQRDAARVAVKQAQAALTEIKAAIKLDKKNPRLIERRSELLQRFTEITNDLRALNAAMGSVTPNHDLGDYLIEMFRARVTKTQWEVILADARKQFSADHGFEPTSMKQIKP